MKIIAWRVSTREANLIIIIIRSLFISNDANYDQQQTMKDEAKQSNG